MREKEVYFMTRWHKKYQIYWISTGLPCINFHDLVQCWHRFSCH